jgi:hypothetical protein
MLSFGAGPKTFEALKGQCWVKIFELSVHKMCNFRHISACQWTMPGDFSAKKNQTKNFCSC